MHSSCNLSKHTHACLTALCPFFYLTPSETSEETGINLSDRQKN